MLLKLFITYISIFFASAVAFVVYAKQVCDTFAAGGKKPIIVSILMALLTALVAYGVSLIIDNLFWVYWVFAFIYLLLGVFQLTYIHKKYFYQTTEKWDKAFVAELVFSLSTIFFAVVFFSVLQYFFRDKSFLFYPTMLSGFFFFVPLLLMHSFSAAYNIPQANFPTWTYPSMTLDLPDESSTGKLLVIGFEIAKKETDNKKTYFRAKAPENMVLGELYYHFINDYNELQSETPIHYVTKDNELQEWWFRIKPKWYQKNRILDPEMTVKANKIKENTVIICERINNTIE